LRQNQLSARTSLSANPEGGGYIFIDGKVSRTTIDQVYYLSKLAMRESLFRIFNPSDPLITHTYNPLIKAVQNIDKSNVAETLIKLLDPIPDSPMWTAVF
jgi:hypothetical protein